MDTQRDESRHLEGGGRTLGGLGGRVREGGRALEGGMAIKSLTQAQPCKQSVHPLPFYHQDYTDARLLCIPDPHQQLWTDTSTNMQIICALTIRRLLRILDRIKSANIVRVIVLITGMCMIAHWLACIWWVVQTSAHLNVRSPQSVQIEL